MTSVIFRAEIGNSQLGPSPAALLQSDPDNRTVEQRIRALHSQPSPGSLRVDMTSERSVSERIFDALADVKILTSQVAMHLDTEWRHKLFRQLDSLHDIAEWEPGDEPIERESFTTFLRAILSINPKRRPGLGLSQAGYLVAAWKTSDDLLTIEFLGLDRVRWVLSRRKGDVPERFAGETRVDRLVASLAQYNPDHWFEYAKEE
jgi:hypothetical protein